MCLAALIFTCRLLGLRFRRTRDVRAVLLNEAHNLLDIVMQDPATRDSRG